MNKLLLILSIFICFIFQAQKEKRLALVIGNSDYQHMDKLKNPVNDAVLMAQIFDSLGFEVLLDTNITTSRKFVKSISDFGAKRDSFDVGFIFYAGHGMQVDGKNYLIPTDEEFSTEAEVKQFAVGAEVVMDFLTKQTDQVNVLILDACRNNPLKNSRSVNVGGLAEMQAKGSLIAFSTTAGNVAKDGNGNHSVYCISLGKNMLIEGISINQVFRNVRREVFEKTGQSTVNYDQLTGETEYYLVQNTFTDELKQIDDLIADEKYLAALEIASHIVELSPNNAIAHYKKAIVYSYLEKNESAHKSLDKAFTLDSNYVKIYNLRGIIYAEQKKYDLAIKEYERGIALAEIDPIGAAYCYNNRATQYERLREFDKALSDYNSAIALEPENAARYNSRAIFYEEYLKDYDLALLDFTKVIELDVDEPDNWYNRANLYIEKLNENKKALADLNECVKLDPENYLIERAKFLYRQKDFKNAENDFNTLVDLDKNYFDSYNERGLFFGLIGEYDKAHKDFAKSIELDTTSRSVYYYRHKIYEKQGLIEKQKADLLKTIAMDPKDPEGYYYLAIMYENKGNMFKAVKNYNIAVTCLEAPEGYIISDGNGDEIPKYKIYLKVAELYKSADEIEMMCEEYQKALKAAEDDLDEKGEIQELINAACK
ncbi:MAG: caspase family protein [Flavobacteriales bacterium]|nr:caspase family protein [Flavobacteriales bacterium]